MAAANLTTITNISKQVVPILVGSVPLNFSNASSDITSRNASQMQIAPGAEFSVETRRVDLAQLDQLRRLNLITYVSR